MIGINRKQSWNNQNSINLVGSRINFSRQRFRSPEYQYQYLITEAFKMQNNWNQESRVWRKFDQQTIDIPVFQNIQTWISTKKTRDCKNVAHFAYVIHVSPGLQKKTHTIAVTTESSKMESGSFLLICACTRSDPSEAIQWVKKQISHTSR